jgi:hypothetical protein
MCDSYSEPSGPEYNLSEKKSHPRSAKFMVRINSNAAQYAGTEAVLQ